MSFVGKAPLVVPIYLKNLSNQNSSGNNEIFALEQFQGRVCGLSGNASRLAPVQFDGYIS